MSAPSLSNVFSDVYITGNCTVKGTISSLAGSITSQWTTSGSTIYYNTGNVGIGTATPGQVLTVNATTAANIFSAVSGSSSYWMYNNTADSRRTFVGMDGTGLFAFSTGALALGTDNTPIIFAPSYGSGEKMRILTSGFVGIGTTNPGSLLTVSGGGSFGSGYTGFTAPTGGLIVQGNVGIGTSNPGVNALQVSGNVVTSGFTSNSTNTVFNFDTLTVPFVNTTLVGIGTTGTTTPLQIYTSNSGYGFTLGSYATSLDITSGSRLGIPLAGWTTIDPNGGSTLATGLGIWDALVVGGYCIIGTTYSQSAIQAGPANGLIVQGNVGIGTASPGYLLDVLGIVRAGSTIGSSIYLTNSEVKWRGDGTSHFSIFNQNSTLQIRNTSGNSEPGTAGSNLLTINTTGYVGIGSTNPTTTLDVNGTIRTSGQATNALILYFLSTCFTQQVSYVNAVDTSLTLSASYIPAAARAVLADVFIAPGLTGTTADHEVFNLGSVSNGSQKTWVEGWGTNPNTMGTLNNQIVRLLTDGENGGGSSFFMGSRGIWFPSLTIPIAANGVMYYSNFGNSGSSGYIYLNVKGYYM